MEEKPVAYLRLTAFTSEETPIIKASIQWDGNNDLLATLLYLAMFEIKGFDIAVQSALIKYNLLKNENNRQQ